MRIGGWRKGGEGVKVRGKKVKEEGGSEALEKPEGGGGYMGNNLLKRFWALARRGVSRYGRGDI